MAFNESSTMENLANNTNMKIRNNIRSSLNESRRLNRDKVFGNKRKALHDPLNFGRDITDAEVVLVGNKLKNKSAVQVDDLNILKLAFVQNVNNIVTFLKVKGALHSLVRELSSGKSHYQLAAAECICNLGLGDAKTCMMVAKAASTYLITHLSSSNYNLVNASVWALANLVGSDEKTWKLIHSQGFLEKLLKMIKIYDTPSNLQVMTEIQLNSLNALVHLLKTGRDLLSTEEVSSIVNTIGSLGNTSTKGLRESEYLLTCVDSALPMLVTNKVHLRCLQFLDVTDLNDETVVFFTPALRTVANLASEPTGVCCLDICVDFGKIKNVAQKIFASPFRHLFQEFGWLLGNMINHPSPEVKSALEAFISDFELLETQLKFLSL